MSLSITRHTTRTSRLYSSISISANVILVALANSRGNTIVVCASKGPDRALTSNEEPGAILSKNPYDSIESVVSDATSVIVLSTVNPVSPKNVCGLNGGVYMVCVGTTVGRDVGDCPVGDGVVGTSVGREVVGYCVGGENVGAWIGLVVGSVKLGTSDGAFEGILLVGDALGVLVGRLPLGCNDGTLVGSESVGVAEGAVVGLLDVGAADGAIVGFELDGAEVDGEVDGTSLG